MRCPQYNEIRSDVAAYLLPVIFREENTHSNQAYPLERGPVVQSPLPLKRRGAATGQDGVRFPFGTGKLQSDWFV